MPLLSCVLAGCDVFAHAILRHSTDIIATKCRNHWQCNIPVNPVSFFDGPYILNAICRTPAVASGCFPFDPPRFYTSRGELQEAQGPESFGPKPQPVECLQRAYSLEGFGFVVSVLRFLLIKGFRVWGLGLWGLGFRVQFHWSIVF